MSTIAQVGNAQASRSSRPPPLYTSQCTHVRMDRIYGNWRCDLCRCPSPLHWLYRCTTDDSLPGDYVFFKTMTHPVSPPAQELRLAGLSESVIKQYEQGCYTEDQIRILLNQKRHLQEVIENCQPADKSLNEFPHPRGPPCSTDERCRTRVCHRCRPYLKERCWMSFGAVFDGEIPALDEDEMAYILPVKDVHAAKRLGLRPPQPLISTCGLDDSPNYSIEHSPSSACTSEGFTSEEASDEEVGEKPPHTTQEPDQSGDQTRIGDEDSPEFGSIGPFVTVRGPRRAEIPQCSTGLAPETSVPHRLRRVSGSITDRSTSRSHTSSSSISLPTIPTTTSYTTLPDYDDEVQKIRSRPSLKTLTEPGTRLQSNDT